VSFHPGEGISEPSFSQVYYPSGSGVARTAIDDARLANAMGRFVGASLSFEVNEAGVPVRFRIERASGDVWGTEALAVVQNWRFKPGEKNGIPVSVPATVDMIWGERNLTSNPLPILRGLTSSDPQHPSHVACRTNPF
jgi:TonB family protein